MSRKCYSYEIWQAGMQVASGSGMILEDVRADMLHYAMQYLRDGPIEIKASPELQPEER